MSMNRNDEVLIPIPKPSPLLAPLMPPIAKPVSQLVQRLRTDKIIPPSFPVCASLKEDAEFAHREYLRLFAQNQQANRRLAAIVAQRNQLADRYNSLKRAKGSQEYVKRRRRQAKDIAREFFCPVDKCRKGYGSEGSLTHHVRLKHKEYFDSGEYELFLQKYLQELAHKEVKTEHVKIQEKDKEEPTKVKQEQKIKQQNSQGKEAKQQAPSASKTNQRRQSSRISKPVKK